MEKKSKKSKTEKEQVKVETPIENKLETENNIKSEEDSKKRHNNQLKWIIGIMTVIILGILFIAWVSSESKKFEYLGLNFQKEKFGNIPIYSTQISGYNVNAVPMNFKLSLRNDPRKSEVPVDSIINILGGNDVYISFNSTDGNECGDGYVFVGLGMYMANLGFNVKTAVLTKKMALETNRTYVDCTNNKTSTIFVIAKGNETKIERDQKNKNCYYLKFKDCESLQVIERFEMATLAGLMDKELPPAVGEVGEYSSISTNNLANNHSNLTK